MPALTVADFMSKNPHAIEPHESLGTAEARLGKLRIQHLPVRAAGKLVGIITDRDLVLIRSVPAVDFKTAQVGSFMSTDVLTVKPSDPLREVAATMADRHVGSAVVVDGTALVGIFTTTDALRALVKLT